MTGQEYPPIKTRAEIHWGDEPGTRNDCQHGRSYAPRGKTPTRSTMAKRLSVNMISAVTNQRKMEFMIYYGKMDRRMLLRLLEQLIKGRDGKLFLILDNLTVHHGKIVREWCQETKRK